MQVHSLFFRKTPRAFACSANSPARHASLGACIGPRVMAQWAALNGGREALSAAGGRAGAAGDGPTRDALLLLLATAPPPMPPRLGGGRWKQCMMELL